MGERFADFYDVSVFVLGQLRSLLKLLYETPKFSFLFNMAILPVILLFAFDLLFSFLMSFKLKRLFIFNVLSIKSWHSLSANNVNRLKPDMVSPRFTRPAYLLNKILKRFNVKKKTVETKEIHTKNISKSSDDLQNYKNRYTHNADYRFIQAKSESKYANRLRKKGIDININPDDDEEL